MARKQKASLTANGSGQLPPKSDHVRQCDDLKLEISSSHLRALESIYFMAMLEEARLFEVVDRLVTRFGHARLPLGPGRAGAVLYDRWRDQSPRLTPEQRRNVYARAFGLAGGDASVMPNRKFSELWVRFVSTVGMYAVELQSLPPDERSVQPEEVLASARELAGNLSAHAYGLAWFAAPDFKLEMQQIVELLSDAELQSTFYAEDPWQVIRNVAALELGARPNVSRARTRAESGVVLLRWLANRRVRLLRPPRSGHLLKHQDICEGRTAASKNKKANVHPTDADLVNACEQWLAVSGMQEAELQAPAALASPVAT